MIADDILVQIWKYTDNVLPMLGVCKSWKNLISTNRCRHIWFSNFKNINISNEKFN